MHSVERSPAPDFLSDLGSTYTQWNQLCAEDRRRIRDALIPDFGTICAYCERPCHTPIGSNAADAGDEQGCKIDLRRVAEESVDHFRPRKHFPQKWLDWPNLLYACYRCNQSKCASWPGFDDTMINEVLAGGYPRYLQPREYVDPNRIAGKRAAQDFFVFDPITGEIEANEVLSDMEWSTALRTVRDIDLNDHYSGLEENDERHLVKQRKAQRDLLIRRLNGLSDFDMQLNIMFEFMQPDKPFSSFIAAYVLDRFPILKDFLR